MLDKRYIMIINLLTGVFFLLFASAYSLKHDQNIIRETLTGIFNYNSILESPNSIVMCINDTYSSNIVDFITHSLQKGAQGGTTDILSIVDDLKSFYDTIPLQIKQCLEDNEQLLKVSYKYGIGFIPLAEDTFKNYTKQNYLKIHAIFSDVRQIWDSKQYQKAGYQFAKYGKIIFPVKKKQIRGVWLTNVASEVLSSRQNIRKAVQICHQAHINTIFVVVYNNARTIYPSSVMENLIGVKQQQKYSGRDPLQQVIDAANLLNIQVHAWFQYGFSSSYSAQGGPIIQKKPSWKSLNVNGDLVVKNGFDWLNGFDPEVQQFMINLFKEVITNYRVDGVQGDDRLPALPSVAGYEDYTISLYKQEHQGIEPPKDYKDQQWIQWRVKKLNLFMKKLYLQVKTLKPTIFLSVSPSPYPWSVQQYLQDWPTWVKYNWVDAVIPQCYRYNFQAYKAVLTQQLSYFINQKVNFGAGVLLNIGDYVANITFLSEIIDFNRNLQIEGESFFFYQGIPKQYDWFTNQYHYEIAAIK